MWSQDADVCRRHDAHVCRRHDNESSARAVVSFSSWEVEVRWVEVDQRVTRGTEHSGQAETSSRVCCTGTLSAPVRP